MIRVVVAFAALVVGTAVFGLTGALAGSIYPARWIERTTTLIWAAFLLAACGVRIRVEGAKHIADGAPAFFVGNHQSALDIPILFRALRGRVRFITKDSLFRIPAFGWILRRFGYVSVTRSNPRETLKSLERAVEQIRRRPISHVVFPEGTRSEDGRLLPFRRGAMKICQRAGLPVVPFAIDGSVAVLRRGEYRIHPGEVRLAFAPPIPAEEVTTLSQDDLLNRVRSAVARGLGQASDVVGACHTARAEARGSLHGQARGALGGQTRGAAGATEDR